MSYTPVEIRHVRVGRRPLGYHRAGVEQILSDVADSFETVWRDRGELQDKVEVLEQALAEAREREQLLTNTLVAAEHAAEEMRDRARREAQLIVSEAHAEARSVMHSGQAERERLLAEVRRIESLLRSALTVVGEAETSSEAPAEQTPVEAQPQREESRELRPVVQPQPEAADVTPEPVAEQTQVVDDDTPGWPPLRKVAQGGHDFDWGD
jgi:cell division initiation protein